MARYKKRKFNLVEENAKDYIAYKNICLYAHSDIPIIESTSTNKKNSLLTVNDVWRDFSPMPNITSDFISETGNKKTYTFVAKKVDDGNLEIETNIFCPSFDSKKAVILIGEYDKPPEQNVIDAIVKTGCYVFVPDYNGIKEDTKSSFPHSLIYGKHGNEGNRNKEVCPAAKDTCQYLYTEILRRLIDFIRNKFGHKEIIAVGIRSGTELAMQLSGVEKNRIIGVACLCGAGYPELADIPKYTQSNFEPDQKTLAWMTAVSGVAYMRNYKNPVFIGLGSNSTISDIDRLASFKSLLSGSLTISVSSQNADNIDKRSFDQFLKWLNCVYWKCDFPSPPKTNIEVKKDGTVYASIFTNDIIPVKKTVLYYSYGDPNHKTRRWDAVVGETVGSGQNLAKLQFTKQYDDLFYYTETTYINGMITTEVTKHFKIAPYRLRLSPEKNNSIMFIHGTEGHFCEISPNAIIMEEGIVEGITPSGTKGSVYSEGSMCLYVADNCRNADPSKILQVDAYSSQKKFTLTLSATLSNTKTQYMATKNVNSVTTFADIKFTVGDFKDEYFRPLTSWNNITSITIVNKNVIINKMLFI